MVSIILCVHKSKFAQIYPYLCSHYNINYNVNAIIVSNISNLVRQFFNVNTKHVQKKTKTNIINISSNANKTKHNVTTIYSTIKKNKNPQNEKKGKTKRSKQNIKIRRQKNMIISFIQKQELNKIKKQKKKKVTHKSKLNIKQSCTFSDRQTMAHDKKEKKASPTQILKQDNYSYKRSNKNKTNSQTLTISLIFALFF